MYTVLRMLCGLYWSYILCFSMYTYVLHLFNQVKNSYDTEELSGAHEQPLDSCIEDCEQGMADANLEIITVTIQCH